MASRTWSSAPSDAQKSFDGDSQRFGPETEDELDRWVMAKRERDFATADAIRLELRARGIEPDRVRPCGQRHNDGRHSSSRTQSRWEHWPAAKRGNDFETADVVRKELRAKGLEPDIVRAPAYEDRLPPRQAPSVIPPPFHHPPQPASKWKVEATTPSHVRGGQFDTATEEKLDSWVAAKRARDFNTADMLRSELRAEGIEPEMVRKSTKEVQPRHTPVKSYPQVSTPRAPWHEETRASFNRSGRYDDTVEAQLDEWVAAKRDRNYELADSIRKELREMGVEPATARPSGRDVHHYHDVKSDLVPHVSVPHIVYPPGRNSMRTAQNEAGAPVRRAQFSSQRTMFDVATEAQLDRWVIAKREKDFDLADDIRNDLWSRGIDPDAERPADKNVHVPVQTPTSRHSTQDWGNDDFDVDVEARLDEWVVAKRERDFVTADNIRRELRALGIEPDNVRPLGYQMNPRYRQNLPPPLSPLPNIGFGQKRKMESRPEPWRAFSREPPFKRMR